jgi:hypothetical protein
MRENPNDKSKETPNKITEEVEQKIKDAEKHKELTNKISETIGKLLDAESLETAVFCCVTNVGPIIFWRGELLSATKAATMLRNLLVQQIQNEINEQ